MNPTKKIKLGWLIPYSNIFRQLRSDLQQGLDTALRQQMPDMTIECHPEYINSGSVKDTEDALRKLLQYHDVDLVFGVMSSKTAIQMIPLLESRQKPVFLLNLGADIPSCYLSSDYLFYNSLHLWQSEWVIGKWAQQQFGGSPSINLSIYESGYSLHETFRTGTAVSGAATVQLNIVKNFVGPPDTLPLINYIREQQPQHAHALLSGKEGEQFLQLFGEARLGAATALTVNPFMVEDGLFNDVPPGLELYNATSWSLCQENDENQSFVRDYTAAYGEAPNAFSLLAHEAGLVLTAALRETGTGREDLREAVGRVSPTGPRGRLRLSTRPLQTTGLPIHIRKPESNAQTGVVTNKILETTTGIEWDTPNLVPEQALMTGWQNPYLCV